MYVISLVAIAATAAVLTSGHPGEHYASEDVARSAEMDAAHFQARKCANAISQFEQMRRDLRIPLAKRQIATTTAPLPHYTTIQNSTCVTAGEIEEGPFYIGNEIIRYDLREAQPGVTLVLDIGVIDTTTCEPFPQGFVEIWSANATGAYGGYQSAGGVHQDTFLRGGHYTDDQGMLELTTLYPGFYQGRTAHIHVMVHKDTDENTNGTIVSSSGTLTHIGQFFFDESFNDQVFATSPYILDKNNRTLNSEDYLVRNASSSAFLNIEPLGDSLDDGLLGYITVAIDSSKQYKILNKNVLRDTVF